MSYNPNKKARIKDVKSSMLRLKAITEDHEQRLLDLEDLAEALMMITNSVINNLTKEE